MRRLKQTPDIGGPKSGQSEAGDQEASTTRWYALINKDLAARITGYAKRQSYHRSTIVTMALQEFLDRHAS